MQDLNNLVSRIQKLRNEDCDHINELKVELQDPFSNDLE